MYSRRGMLAPYLWFLIILHVLIVKTTAVFASISLNDLRVADNVTFHSINVDFNPFNTYTTYAITFANSGNSPIAGPLYLAIENLLPSSVTVDWPMDISTEGIPYHKILDPELSPGEIRIRLVRFKKPKRRTRFTFMAKIYYATSTPSNTPPIANAGEDRTISVGDVVTLDGTNSTDADGDSLTYQWSFQSIPVGSSAILSGADSQSPSFTVDSAGNYVISLVVNDEQAVSVADTVQISTPIDNDIPTIEAVLSKQPNSAGWLNQDVTVTFFCDDRTSSISFCSDPMTVSSEGVNQLITGTTTDGAGNTASTSVLLNIDKTPPVVTIDAPLNNSELTNPEVVATGLVDDINKITTFIVNGEPVSLDVNGNFNQTINLVTGLNELEVIATDIADNIGDATVAVTVVENNGGSVIPPDPSEVAPPINPSMATSLAAATSFLYSGTNPIQRGVTDDVINIERAAVLRGIVRSRENQPLSGVKVSVHNHPEYGQTLTRLDGVFDIAVNGGSYLTVEYERDGYLPVQRTINVPWQDYTWLPGIVMIPVDPQVTSIDLNAAVPIQVARSSVVTDSDGVRQATLLFSEGTHATMIMPNGTTQPLTTMNVRATEYTVGDNGPEAMPAELPPLTGYTYAVDYTVDEALNAQATDVQFDKPVLSYLENFMGFPVGSTVPVGYYDRNNSRWVPSDNGRVIQLLSIDNGVADIDVDGSGQPADTTALATLGISTPELEQLAILYITGQRLWRVPISHFTPFDKNWPLGPPEGARYPIVANPTVEDFDKHDDPDCQDGSIIECENQILRESINIVGTPFSLNYSSDRVPGRNSSTAIIPLSGDTVHALLKRIEVKITIAGRRFNYSFQALPQQEMIFTWDGKDAYGRVVYGAQRARIEIINVFDGVYYSREEYPLRIFGLPPDAIGVVNATREEVSLSTVKSVKLTAVSGYNHAQDLGGWSLNVLHEYVPNNSTLYLGTGARRTAQRAYLDMSTVISTLAGDGIFGYSGDGGSALSAHLAGPRDVVTAMDGSVYIADSSNNRIRRVSPDGTIATVAGNGDADFNGDGGPAVQAALNFPTAVSIGPNGALLISDSNNLRIRRVGTDGIISTVIGLGIPLDDIITTSGCAVPDPRRPGSFIVATSEGCVSSDFVFAHPPGSTAFGADGSIYFALPNEHLIYHLGNDGIVTIYAGTGINGYNGEGISSRDALITYPSDILMAPDGNLIFTDSDNNRVRQIRSDGIVRTIAGTGDADYTGDGGSAEYASFSFPTGIALDSGGELYILDINNNRVRKISSDGVINTVIGNGASGQFIEGGLAKNTFIGESVGIAIGPDGRIFIPQPTVNRLYNITVSLPSFNGDELIVPSKEGNLIYHFDPYGRHISTTNAYTGEVLYQFEYVDNYLASITDGDGNATLIEREQSTHIPSAIISPDGQHTLLSVSPGGYLSQITNPAGEHFYFYIHRVDSLKHLQILVVIHPICNMIFLEN